MKKINIIDIPEKMKKFYGEGTMLHPIDEIVENEVKRIPFGKVATIGDLCQKLATDHGTNVTCPMRTGNIIKKMAEQAAAEVSAQIPYWRLIRSDEMVIKSKVYEVSAAKIAHEGFELEYMKSGNIKVKNSENQRFTFDMD